MAKNYEVYVQWISGENVYDEYFGDYETLESALIARDMLITKGYIAYVKEV